MALGVVERLVGAAEQARKRVAGHGQRETDADRDLDALTAIIEAGGLGALAQCACQLFEMFCIRYVREDGELLAAKA